MLIADDVADTGATLELVHDFCAGRVAEARVAVLYEKSRSAIASDYVWRRTDDWITFPWSAIRPSAAGRRSSQRCRHRQRVHVRPKCSLRDTPLRLDSVVPH